MGSKKPIHPNDDVNKRQSSNDTFPTAMYIAAAEQIEDVLLPGVSRPARHARGEGRGVRRRRQDRPHPSAGRDADHARPGVRRLGRAARTGHRHVRGALPGLLDLAIGGTAVGTGLNAHPKFGETAARQYRRVTGRPFMSAANNSPPWPPTTRSSSPPRGLRTLAGALMKIANDVRWLASGPRCGIGEIALPENEPGSSIMPGQGQPDAVRGPDDGLRPGVRQRRRGRVRRVAGQLRAERLQARDGAQRARFDRPARRRLPRVQRPLRGRHRAGPARASRSTSTPR